MIIYVLFGVLVGIIGGIMIAACTKKAEGVTYGKLDRVGVITNILLIPFYVIISPLYLFLGMISEASYDGFLGILGWIIAFIIASAAIFCGLGLGFSVALRKKGKSKPSFAIQFAGVAAIALTVLLYCIFVGNLLRPLN